MKKIIVLVLCGCMTVGMFTGCSGSTSSTPNSESSAVTESEEPEIKYCDEDFIADVRKGLESRWKLVNNDSSKDGYDDITLDSEENKQMTINYIDAELSCVEDYTSGNFKDSYLQEQAISYINALKNQKDAVQYITVDYDKYDEIASDVYDTRSAVLKNLVNNYGLTVSEEYQDTLNELLTNANIVEEENAINDELTNMINNVVFEQTSNDGSGWCTYQGLIENTTGKDFDSADFTINLYNDDDVLVDTQYDTIPMFNAGTKAYIEFSTDVEFSGWEMQVSCY